MWLRNMFVKLTARKLQMINDASWVFNPNVGLLGRGVDWNGPSADDKLDSSKGVHPKKEPGEGKAFLNLVRHDLLRQYNVFQEKSAAGPPPEVKQEQPDSEKSEKHGEEDLADSEESESEFTSGDEEILTKSGLDLLTSILNLL